MERSKLVVLLLLLLALVGCGSSETPITPGSPDAGGPPPPPPMNHPPTLSAIADVTMLAGQTRTLTLDATDPDRDPIAFSSPSLPSYASMSGNTLTLAPTVSHTDVITIVASDGKLSDQKSFTVAVAPAPVPPVVSLLAQMGPAGSLPSGSVITSPPTLQASVVAAPAYQVKLEAELAPAGTAFKGQATHTGALSPQGTLTIPLGSLTPGAYKWQVRAIDEAGLPGDWVSFAAGGTAFTIQAGILNGTISVKGTPQAVRSLLVDVNLAVTSQGGALATMELSNDNGRSDWSPPEPYAATRTGWGMAKGANGVRTVYARVTDVVGNSAVFTGTIVLDTGLPVISSFQLESGAAATSAASPAYSVIASDSGSGLYQLCVGGQSPPTDKCGAYGAGGSLPLAEGAQTVYAQVFDMAGNASPVASASILVDRTRPTVPGGLSLVSRFRAVEVHWTAATDAGSGISGYQVGMSDSGTGPFTWQGVGNTTATTVAPLTNGSSKFFVVRAVDNAGNAGDYPNPLQTAPHYPFDFQFRIPTPNAINALVMTSATSALLASDTGGLWTTTDGWASRSRKDLGTDANLTGMARGSFGEVVVVADDGKIYFSPDGQNGWKPALNNAGPSALRAVAFSGKSAGVDTFVAVGDDGNAILAGRYEPQGTPVPTFDPVAGVAAQPLRAVAACISAPCDGTVVVAGDASKAAISTDHGHTWTAIHPPAGDYKAVTWFPGYAFVFVGGSTGMFSSATNGAQWGTYTKLANTDVRTLLALDGSIILVGGLDKGQGGVPIIGRYVNASDTWTQSIIFDPGVRALAASDTSHASFGGTLGYLATTADAGVSWQQIGGRSIAFNHIAFADTSNGAAASNSGYVAVTSDGGTTWAAQLAISNVRLYGVTMVTPAAVMAVGTGGSVVLGQGGLWTKQTTPTSVDLNAVSCPTTSLCYAVGANQTVLEWKNSSWTQLTTTTGGAYRAVTSYLDTSNQVHVITVGDDGYFRTLAGTTWTSGTVDPAGPYSLATLHGVAARPDGTVLGVGVYGRVFRSRDHGRTWANAGGDASFPNLDGLDDIAASPSGAWIVAGTAGNAWKSTDDGDHFSKLWTGTTADLGGVTIKNWIGRDYVWIAGKGPDILFSSSGGE